MFSALSSPELVEAVSRKNKSPSHQPVVSILPAPAPSGPVVSPQHSSGGVDFELQAKADSLHSAEHGPQRDLEVVAEFLQTYARATGGQPIGDNSDITAAISGTQYPGQKGRVFPKNHRAVKDGKLVDRWGEPLWFHPNSGNSMEIRSAGPDKQLFTPDDVIVNPSPGGFGVTPPASGEMPQ
jgi:hypothetical protein